MTIRSTIRIQYSKSGWLNIFFFLIFLPYEMEVVTKLKFKKVILPYQEQVHNTSSSVSLQFIFSSFFSSTFSTRFVLIFLNSHYYVLCTPSLKSSFFLSAFFKVSFLLLSFPRFRKHLSSPHPMRQIRPKYTVNVGILYNGNMFKKLVFDPFKVVNRN